MKVVLLAGLATLAVLASAEDSPVFDYHRKFGIPEASRIKALEDRAASQRIVGGSVTDITNIPYQVGLVIQVMWSFNSVCGGALVSPWRVVTAAHCHHDGYVTAQQYTVVLGSNTLFAGGQRIGTTNAAVHPQWDPRTALNDIAYITLSAPVILSEVVRPVALPSGQQLSDDFANRIAVASGYGFTSEGGSIEATQRLSSVKLAVITNDVCADVLGRWVHNTNICTSGEGGRGPCIGDSGGPLVFNNTLIGVTSFRAAAGCDAGLPTAYTRVPFYVDWIKSF